MKTINLRIKLFLFLLLLVGNQAIAQQPRLTLEKVFKTRLIRSAWFPEVRWLPDGNGYLLIEPNRETGGMDIVKYDVKTGDKSVLIASKSFIPEGQTTPLDFDDYTWSNDNTKLLLFTNTARVWRYNTKGDYWVLNLQSGKLQKLGRGIPASTMMFAKFSPDAKQVAYVSKNNIYVETIDDGTISQITTDGCDFIINGTFDWVYEEELDCRDGFRWSPDGKYIAYWQSDTRGTGTFYMINNIDSIYSQVIPIPYPKVGTTNSAVRVGVIPAAGGETRWIDIPGDPRENYIARMDFIPASNDLFIQQLNRLQNTNKVWICNANNMQLENILTETDEAWLDLHDDIYWIKDNKYFTWMSERSGWLQMYQVSRDGKATMPLFTTNFDIVSVQGFDEKNGYVYYIATPDKYTERYLFRSRMNGKPNHERLTPVEYEGTNSYNINPKATYAIHRFGNQSTPNQVQMVALPSHKPVRMLADNTKALEDWRALGLNPKEFLRVDIGDVTLDASIIKPVGFDPSRKYPVIFYVYGEPAGTTVQNRWEGGDLWHQLLAQQGYIVMSVDNRGTNVPRGRAWRKSIYGQIGILASKDQAAAARKIFEMYPFIDTSRVGIWGWSGGGSMTLNMMFRYPGIYKTGIAVAFVSDELLYDNVYQERYMSLPSLNPDGYEQGSPITHAANLRGNLMLIHGTGDDNVHYQNCELLVDRLIALDKPFSMMAYPNRSHGIYERENTTLHLYRTMLNYWTSNLAPGPR